MNRSGCPEEKNTIKTNDQKKKKVKRFSFLDNSRRDNQNKLAVFHTTRVQFRALLASFQNETSPFFSFSIVWNVCSTAM